MRSMSPKLEVEVWKYRSNPVLKDTDFDGIDDGFGYERDSEGKYKTDKNNEKIPINKNKFKDKTPKSNYFKGKLNSSRISGSGAIEVDMNMDYRYFFLNNKLYYDELSTMSLLYANSIYMQGDKQEEHSGVKIKSGNNFSDENSTKDTYKYDIIELMDYDKFKNLKVKEMMEHFGFKNVRTYYLGNPGDLGDENREYFLKNFAEKDEKTKEPTGKVDLNKLEIDETYKDKNKDRIGTRYKYKKDDVKETEYIDEIYLGYRDTHKSRVAIGYKNIEYHGLYKTVVGIVVRGTAEDDDWDSDFDMGDKKLRNELMEYIAPNGNKIKYGYKYMKNNEEVVNNYLIGGKRKYINNQGKYLYIFYKIVP